jgi:hypothetical protein
MFLFCSMIHIQPSTAAEPLDPSSDREGDAWDEIEALDVRAAERTAMLRTLAEKGLELALALQEEAMARIAAKAPGDNGAGFVRAARMVRQTLALEARLNREWRPLADQAVVEQAAQAAAEAGERGRARLTGFINKQAVCEAVEAVIDAEAGDGEARSEPLRDALYERLNDPSDETDFVGVSIGGLVERICKALGLAPDWDILSDEDWAITEAESADPDSPFSRVRETGRRLIAPWERPQETGPP